LWITISDENRPAPGDGLLGYMDYLGFATDQRVAVASQQAMLGYVSARQGFALLPASVGKTRFRNVAFRPGRDRLPTFDVTLTWRSHEADPDVLELLKSL
jgi:DNA-binding transcriptional LysR family regulator